MQTGNLTYEHWIVMIVIFVFWLLRKHPILGWLWKITACFFVVLFATIAADLLKDRAKKWWDS